ncbi:hypothetical protein [Halocatena marina]|uniref:hypothetical protein n=1 Tax=Halocatena marina TaxID=2934937 RepID=UPI0036F28563
MVVKNERRIFKEETGAPSVGTTQQQFVIACPLKEVANRRLMNKTRIHLHQSP